MADGEVRAQDLTQETTSTLSGNEEFVMFDSTEGKRADIDDIATYIAGDKANLQTTDKSSTVAAINENHGVIEDLKEDLGQSSQNLFYSKVMPITYRGVSFSEINGGAVLLDGTATQTAKIALFDGSVPADTPMSAGTYSFAFDVISGAINVSNNNSNFSIRDNTDTAILTLASTRRRATVTFDSAWGANIYIGSGTVLDDAIVRIWITKTNEVVPFEPRITAYDYHARMQASENEIAIKIGAGLLGNALHAFESKYFVRGAMAYGELNPSIQYRVSTEKALICPYQLTLKVEPGYRYGVFLYDGTNWTDVAGWMTKSYTIAENTKFKIVIAKVTEDSSSVANIDEFVSKIKLSYGGLIGGVDLIDYSYPSLRYIKDKRCNGGTLNNDIFVWIRNNSYDLWWVNILTGENGSVSATNAGLDEDKAGHCNDLTYYPIDDCYYMATMKDNGPIVKLSSAYVYQSSVNLVDGDSNPLVSEGIAYDRINNRFVVGGLDGNFYLYDTSWNYVSKIIPNDTNPDTMQGIETDGYYIYRVRTDNSYRAFIRTYEFDGNYLGEIEIAQMKGGELENIAYSWEHNYFAGSMNITINNVASTKVMTFCPNNMPAHIIGETLNRLRLLL